jgi:hypothetical protein
LITPHFNVYSDKEYWNKPLNRRLFFEKYAKRAGFDFKEPRPWYTVTKEEILAENVLCPLFLFFLYFPPLPFATLSPLSDLIRF